MRTTLIAGLISVALLSSPANAAQSVSTSERILLQATMQQSINQQLVDGKYFYFDAANSKVQAVYPAKTHPMILSYGGHFVLCTNFRTKEGKEVNVDFYIARKNESFVVFDTLVDDRAPLHKLMKSGLVKVVK
ncbi:MAG: hypothetical protein GY948_25010 [Alphaproteobacteria bacterium]|nr:hypothetical protein [Alphaproteobacteria bacterium]